MRKVQGNHQARWSAQKVPARDVIVGVRAICRAGQMNEPFPPRDVPEKSRVVPFDPDVPRECDEEKSQNPFPAEQSLEADPGLAIKTGEQTERRRRIKQAVQTLRHASERGANPEADEPAAAASASFIAADRAVDRPGNKGAEDWLRHDDPSEQKCPATTQLNEPREESAPRPAEAFADEKREHDRGEDGERDGEASGCSR